MQWKSGALLAGTADELQSYFAGQMDDAKVQLDQVATYYRNYRCNTADDGYPVRDSNPRSSP